MPPVLISTQTVTGPASTTITVPAGAISARITAVGAAGGAGNPGNIQGGRGASIQGDFAVTPGEALTLLAGGVGGSNPLIFAGGGGGGSFAWRGAGFAALTDPSLLVAAGGGGGAAGISGLSLGFVGVDANATSQSGTTGNPAGGAGIFTDGGAGNDVLLNLGGDGGQAINAGGPGGPGGTFGNTGGFGGGGGGGGSFVLGPPIDLFSGGGGGGSRNNGTNQVNIAGVGTGNRTVTISFFGI